jgi:hypothetical protein
LLNQITHSEPSHDEGLLAGEVPVERGAGDLGLLEDAIDPDAVDAVGVEQTARRREEMVARC